MLAFLVWIFFVAFAVASTLTYGLLHPYIGVVPSYLAALPLMGGAWGIRQAIKNRAQRLRDARYKVDLLSRMELVSWSPEIPGPGSLKLRAEIRALRDLLVRFNGWGIDSTGGCAEEFEHLKAVPVKSGETARFEIEIKVQPDRSMVDYVLEFWTWTGGTPHAGTGQGVFSYEKVEAEIQDGSILRRPLPPAGPGA
jgi:hypothetical protein